MILYELQDLIASTLATRTQQKASEIFGRKNRKWAMSHASAPLDIRLDADFIAGLSALGYELKLVKKGNEENDT